MAVSDSNDQLEHEALAIDIPEEYGDLEPGPDCCIYRVPRRFYETNNKAKAYHPQLISIGPLHHGQKNLARMERQKRRYYSKFVERTSEETLRKFTSFIKEHIGRICRSYDEEFMFVPVSNDVAKFEEIILYDTVFIIEVFLRKFCKEVDDFLFCRGWLSPELRTDLILLENQLPFFVLEGLYDLIFPDGSIKAATFLELACQYFELEDHENAFGGKEIKHFTDLIRYHAVRRRPEDSVSDETIDNMYSATMLHEAGVKFESAAAKDQCLLDVTFEKGVLQMPYFNVTYETETVCRNLIAFEQCHSPRRADFCSYIQLLDFLIDTEEDVNLLKKRGIIFINGMGSSAAVADMINGLMVGVAEFTLCYDGIMRNLNAHYENHWNLTKATLRHVYFNNVFKGTATVAAFIVVLLTLTDTIFAILERAMPT